MTRVSEATREALRNQVDHAADTYSRYPGETIAFYTRVKVSEALTRFRVRITVPVGLALVSTRAMNQPSGMMPVIALDEGVSHVLWDMEREPGSPMAYVYETETTVLPLAEDAFLEGKAVLSADPVGSDAIYLDERVTVAIKAKGRFIKYLPNIYHEDQLMARLLMLFESFLAPIEKQINGQENYLDPRLTPPEFLGWLGSWLGLVMDEDLPEHQRRSLIQEAAGLYKKRGTRQGLIDYIEIVSGGKVEISEHFSDNFFLGPDTIMGPGIALGKNNVPNTFGVTLFLPPLPAVASQQEKDRGKLLWERKACAIIEAEKPVHSGYELFIEYDPKLGK